MLSYNFTILDESIIVYRVRLLLIVRMFIDDVLVITAWSLLLHHRPIDTEH